MHGFNELNSLHSLPLSLNTQSPHNSKGPSQQGYLLQFVNIILMPYFSCTYNILSPYRFHCMYVACCTVMLAHMCVPVVGCMCLSCILLGIYALSQLELYNNPTPKDTYILACYQLTIFHQGGTLKYSTMECQQRKMPCLRQGQALKTQQTHIRLHLHTSKHQYPAIRVSSRGPSFWSNAPFNCSYKPKRKSIFPRNYCPPMFFAENLYTSTKNSLKLSQYMPSVIHTHFGVLVIY